MSWQARIDEALEQRRQHGLLRTRTANQQGAGRWRLQDGQRWLNFASNDYLGLSQHPAVIAGWQQGAARYGVGSGASGHVTGYSEAHAGLEQALANWLGYPRALLFISGFAANQAVIAALAQKPDRIVADRLSHASLLEAAHLSPATLTRFRHNDAVALRAALAKPCEGQQLVVTEGVFSMDGDSAPLAEIAAVSREAQAWLMVDDAHGIGVLGEQGRGSCNAAGIHPELLVVTFGKGFGVSGAAVLCSESLACYFEQFARHLIYSTAMPPAQAVALHAALNCVQQGDALRARLTRHIQRFRDGAQQLPWKLAASHTAIQPLIVGDNHAALALSATLRERGIGCSAIRPPTVPPGTARLRITLTAAHEDEDIDTLLEALHDAAGI